MYTFDMRSQTRSTRPLVNAGLKVSPEMKEALKRLTELYERGEAYIAYRLLQRGFAALLKDGRLEEPTPVVEELPEEMTITIPIIGTVE